MFQLKPWNNRDERSETREIDGRVRIRTAFIIQRGSARARSHVAS